MYAAITGNDCSELLWVGYVVVVWVELLKFVL
jgi:hypothetical protein